MPTGTQELVARKTLQPGVHVSPEYDFPLGMTYLWVYMTRENWPNEGAGVAVETSWIEVSLDGGANWTRRAKGKSQGGIRFEEDGVTEKALSGMGIFVPEPANPNRKIRAGVDVHYRLRTRIYAEWDDRTPPPPPPPHASIVIKDTDGISGLNKTQLTVAGIDTSISGVDYLFGVIATEDAFAGITTSVTRDPGVADEEFTEVQAFDPGSTKANTWAIKSADFAKNGVKDIDFDFEQDDHCFAFVYALSGVDQTTPLRASFTNDQQGGGATSISVTLTDSESGDLVIAVAMGRDSDTGTHDQGTLPTDGKAESAGNGTGGTHYIYPTGANQVMGWTWDGGSYRCAINAVAIRAAGAAPASLAFWQRALPGIIGR
jgi:hypothetical protein